MRTTFCRAECRFKYWAAEKNNFLTIDEPEENLHPENQVKLVDLLIQFAQKNNKVLITTHSPLLANAVNNYIYLDVLKNEYSSDFVDKIVAENNLKYIYNDNSISKDDIGVYFFEGSRIIDYEADEYGVYFRNFREVISCPDN
ncbi:MAG: AAA family ATPase [Cyanobacteria bacterium P01_H01_bin.35]